MAEEIFDLVLEYGGAISSEHGDGRARSPFLERVFGPAVFQAFREFKSAFDPKGRMTSPETTSAAIARCVDGSSSAHPRATSCRNDAPFVRRN